MGLKVWDWRWLCKPSVRPDRCSICKKKLFLSQPWPNNEHVAVIQWKPSGLLFYQLFTLSWPFYRHAALLRLPCAPSFWPKDTREHQNRSLVYFSPTFCLLFVNMPLRLAAWLLSLASSNVVLIKNRWEANRHSKPETETGRVSWNSNEDARLQSAIFFASLSVAFRRLSCLCKFVIFCIREVSRVHLADFWWISSGASASRRENQLSGKFAASWAWRACLDAWTPTTVEAQQVSQPPSAPS